MKKRLLIAEDTRDLNRALVAVLEHEGYEVMPTYDGEEALAALTYEGFDAIILDIMMPKKSGLEVLADLRAEGVNTPVLLLTAKSEVDDRVAGLDAGADDYLAKPFAMKELLARVRSMTRRRMEYDTHSLTFGDMTLDGETFELRASNTVRLSVREFELMQVLVHNADRSLTWRYLLGRVWGNEPDADKDDVELYVSYLRSKLKWVGSDVTIKQDAEGFALALRPKEFTARVVTTATSQSAVQTEAAIPQAVPETEVSQAALSALATPAAPEAPATASTQQAAVAATPAAPAAATTPQATVSSASATASTPQAATSAASSVASASAMPQVAAPVVASAASVSASAPRERAVSESIA